MATDGVTRRRVMRGIGMMAGAGLMRGGEFGGCRGVPHQSADCSFRTEFDSIAQQTWPQFGGTAAKAGYRRGASGPKSSVAFRWQFETTQRISGVVVTESIVYGRTETTLYALSVEDGSELWRIGDKRTFESVSAPAVDTALVYVGTRRASSATDSGSRSFVRALDAVTGMEEWRFEPERAVSGFHSPTVAGGIVYIIGGNFGAGTVGRLYALDSATGTLLWTHTTGTSGINGYEPASVAVEDGVVYLAADALFALDALTGDPYWSVDADVTYKATGKNAPTVTDERLYIGRGTDSASTFEARSVSDGSRAWTYTVTEETEPISKTDTDTGTQQKQVRTGVWTSAAVYDGTVYVGFNERTTLNEWATRIVALSADDGAVRWQRTFSGDRLAVHTPASDGETLYTGGTALRLGDGSVRWRLDSPTSNRMNAFAPPAIVDETVYVGGTPLRAITGRT